MTITEIRQRLKSLKQADVARKMGITRSYVNAIIRNPRGQRSYSDEMLGRLESAILAVEADAGAKIKIDLAETCAILRGKIVKHEVAIVELSEQIRALEG